MVSQEDVEAIIQNTGEDNRFWAARAIAIQSYASLEQALGELFAGLGEIRPEIAGVIFFKITSAQVRDAIIDKLFQLKFASGFNLFRNSLIKALRPLSNERNEIVHWNVINSITRHDDGRMTGTLLLEPPALWRERPSVKTWSIESLRSYKVKCDFFKTIVGMFTTIVVHRREFHGRSESWHNAWRDIFQVAITYPPPADHPSFQAPQALMSP
jgi:hypothetical protein